MNLVECFVYEAICRIAQTNGAAYPVRHGYDTAGRRTSLSTTRDGAAWDATGWTFDPATGLRTAKTYADGSTVTYSYTPDGLPLRETRPSGEWRESAYDSARRIVGIVSSDEALDAAMTRDEFGNVTSESNAVSYVTYALDDHGNVTNEVQTVDGVSVSFLREFDPYGRPAQFARIGGGQMLIGYAADGQIDIISNETAVASYAYTSDRLDAGHSMDLSNGVDFTRTLARDGYRRSLVTNIVNSVAGMAVETLGYTYDALSRPVSRNADTFGYNDRGEVVSSRGVTEDGYAYDEIGNLLHSVANSTTNTYVSNGRNQYASILRDSASPRETSYDLDENMTQCGEWSYAYDSGSRLVSASSNGLVVAAFAYDARGRRVKKISADGTHRYFYDGWLLVYEHVTRSDGTTGEIEYAWGKDVSGTRGGAAGIGGLLYLKRDGEIYVPHYDAFGNIRGYCDARGNVVASYTYDAFGNIVSQSGTMPDAFPFRHSTKYFDSDFGLYYYGYRYYGPQIMRWLTEDPIGVDGGLNLYGFCHNNSLCGYDELGLEWIIERDSSKRWAIARRSSKKDTFMALATKLKLNFNEKAKWLRRNKDNPCLFEVPNVFCVYTSKSGWIDGHVAVVTHLKHRAVSDLNRYKSKGFMVISHKWADSDDTFIDMWTEDGIYAVSFAGHGTVYGFKAETSSDTAVAPDLVCPPYHLAAVCAYSCVSAMYIEGSSILPNGNIPRYSWRDHVSTQGTFIGYNGKVYWFNLSKQEVSINEDD